MTVWMDDKGDGSRFWHSFKFPIVIIRDLVNSVGHSPIFNILLQTMIRASIMASPPANSAGIDQLHLTPIFNALPAALASSCRIGGGPSSGILETVKHC